VYLAGKNLNNDCLLNPNFKDFKSYPQNSQQNRNYLLAHHSFIVTPKGRNHKKMTGKTMNCKFLNTSKVNSINQKTLFIAIIKGSSEVVF
jgi:hypothetical protein